MHVLLVLLLRLFAFSFVYCRRVPPSEAVAAAVPQGWDSLHKLELRCGHPEDIRGYGGSSGTGTVWFGAQYAALCCCFTMS